MDLKQFEQLQRAVYEALKEDFPVDTDDRSGIGKNFCAIPPGILIEILETLIVPVVTALVAELLIRKFMPEKDSCSEKISQSAQMLKSEAENQIDSRAEEILMENQTAGSVVQNVSAKVMLNIVIQTPDDGEKLLSILKQYFDESKGGHLS